MSKVNEDEGRIAEPTGEHTEQVDDGRLPPEEEEMTVSIPEGIAGRDEDGVCGWVETELLVAALAADWTHSQAAELRNLPPERCLGDPNSLASSARFVNNEPE